MDEAFRSGAPSLTGPMARHARATTDRWRVAADLVGVGLVGLIVVMFAIRNTLGQVDLRTCLAAAQTAGDGLDPYRPEHLTAVAKRPTLPFIYPPIALLPFLPLNALPHGLVLKLWMAANVAVLAGLLVSWWRWLGTGIGLLPLALLSVFGWDSSALSALRSGNVALIEAGLIWTALVCFACERRTLFATLIVAAACLKLKPALFLLLMLVPAGRSTPSLRGLLTSLTVLAALVVVPILIGPASHWDLFLRHVPDAERQGASNPGALSLLTVLAQVWGVSESKVRLAGLGGWIVLMLALLAASLPFLRSVFRTREPRSIAMAALFLYLLIDPRPMAYGFVLLTPAVLSFVPRSFEGSTGRLILALVLAAQGLTVALHHGSDSLVFIYAPCLLALCVWLLIIGSPERCPRAHHG